MEIAKKGEPHGGLGHTKVKADFDGHCVYNFFSYWEIGLSELYPIYYTLRVFLGSILRSSLGSFDCYLGSLERVL